MKTEIQGTRAWFHGLLFVALLALASMSLADGSVIRSLRLSPLIVGILVGMLYANTLRSHLPADWVPGVVFSSKTILRLGVILFGFRVTFQQIAQVGVDGLVISVVMVATTFTLGSWIGTRVLKLDRGTSLLTAAGSAVCGAAAVLATEPVVGGKPYQSAVAVGTVVIFGTTSLFLYPILQATGILHLSPTAFGLWAGGTIHEVAQVVGAAAPIGDTASQVAVIVKMTRVMLLAPLLVIVGLTLSARSGQGRRLKVTIPWFAVGFAAASALNSWGILPPVVIHAIGELDTFLLTMAMTALGVETPWSQFRKAGARPVILALILYAWLTVGGYALVRAVTSLGG